MKDITGRGLSVDLTAVGAAPGGAVGLIRDPWSYTTTPERPEHPSGLSPLLVLDLGGIPLRAGGVGIFAVRSPRQRMLPAQIEAFENEPFRLNPIDVSVDRDDVVEIDANDVELPSGTIVRQDEDEHQVMPTHLHRSSLHDSGLTAAVSCRRGGSAYESDAVDDDNAQAFVERTLV